VGAYVGLSGELREYLTIWAIGTIIGVTKDVDMKFTHEYDRAHFQVLVLNPSLIPHSIDVVIGEFIHELHFRVERGEMTNPTPIDMDDDTMEERNEEGPGHKSNPKPSQQDQPAPGSSNQNNSARNYVAGSKQILHGKTLPMHIHALEMVHDFVHGAENAGEEVASGGEAPNSDSSSRSCLMCCWPLYLRRSHLGEGVSTGLSLLMSHRWNGRKELRLHVTWILTVTPITPSPLLYCFRC
jgi:hypothetical protein